MSLSEPSDGLLQTHIHWKDLQQALLQSLGPQALLGPNKEINDISSCNGLCSLMCLLEPDWQQGGELPQQLMVKILSTLNHSKNMKEMMEEGSASADNQKAFDEVFEKMHNYEINAYEFLTSLHDPEIDIVKIYSTLGFTPENRLKGFIVMEKVENVASVHLDTVFEEETILKIMKSVAKLHSTSSKLTPEYLEKMTRGIYSDILYVMFEEKFSLELLEKFRQSLPHHSEKLNILEKLLKKYADFDNLKQLEDIPNRLGMQKVFCHGDLWTANMLFTSTDSHHIQYKAFIDFQQSHVGCGAHDLVRVLTTASSPQQLVHWETYVSKYYSHLEEYYTVIGTKCPYTYDQMEEAVKLLFPIVGYISLVNITLLADSVVATRSDKEKTREYLMQKAAGILDLLVTFADLD